MPALRPRSCGTTPVGPRQRRTEARGAPLVRREPAPDDRTTKGGFGEIRAPGASLRRDRSIAPGRGRSVARCSARGRAHRGSQGVLRPRVRGGRRPDGCQRRGHRARRPAPAPPRPRGRGEEQVPVRPRRAALVRRRGPGDRPRRDRFDDGEGRAQARRVVAAGQRERTTARSVARSPERRLHPPGRVVLRPEPDVRADGRLVLRNEPLARRPAARPTSSREAFRRGGTVGLRPPHTAG